MCFPVTKSKTVPFRDCNVTLVLSQKGSFPTWISFYQGQKPFPETPPHSVDTLAKVASYVHSQIETILAKRVELPWWPEYVHVPPRAVKGLLS